MKRSSRRLIVSLSTGLLLALFVTGVVLAATLVIDNFNTGADTVRAQAGGTNSATRTGTMLGGERDIFVTATGTSGNVRVEAGNGLLTFSSDVLVSGTALITWDGVDGLANTLSLGMGSVDLTDGGTNTGFRLRIVEADNPATITIRAYTNTTGNFAQYVLQVPAGISAPGSVDLFIPFTDFTPSAFTWTDVDALTLFIQGTQNADLALDFFETTSSVGDYGDLPNSGANAFPAGVINAYHTPQGMRFGSNVDAETGPNPSANADGDDLNQTPDDEEGVVPSPGFNWSPATGGSVNVTTGGCSVAVPCYVTGWIDWGKDGSFDQAGDRVVNNVSTTTSGTLVFTFPIPAVDVTNNSFFARFRICPGSGVCSDPTATGIEDGEIEDHLWNFGPNAVRLTSLKAGSSVSPVTTMLLLGLGLAGAVLVGFAWMRRRAR